MKRRGRYYCSGTVPANQEYLSSVDKDGEEKSTMLVVEDVGNIAKLEGSKRMSDILKVSIHN